MNAEQATAQTWDHHVCPWWVGYLLLLPIRRLKEDPRRMLAPHVKPGMNVLEPGSAMGYFSLPLARLVGPVGQVVCVDVQERLIRRLRRRARRAGLAGRIEARLCTQDDMGVSNWNGKIDLAVLIHTLHEAADPRAFLEQVCRALKPGGRLLLVEPAGHVPPEQFEFLLETAREAGLSQLPPPERPARMAALFEKAG